MGRWQCRCTRIRCSGATSRWRPSGLAAGLCGLSADSVHGGKALCMAGWCCIENIELTCAMLRGVDHARPWWPLAPWDTYEVQRFANLWLCGRARQCKCSGGNSTSVSLTFSLCSFGAWWVQGHSPVLRYTPPPPAQGARQPGWVERRGPREHPGERVGARGGGRGRTLGWHTRVTARHRQGGQTYRQGRQRAGKMEGETGERGGAGQRDQGSTEKGRGHTQGAREQQGTRTRKKKSRTGGHTGRAHRGGRAREVGGTGGQRGCKGTQCLTEKYHADDPHRAVPAAPPDHQGTDGGAAGGRGRRGSPPEGVSGEAAQVGLQVGRQGGGP